MNKKKLALISIIVVSTVFCLTIMLNAVIPNFTKEGEPNDAGEVITKSNILVDELQENVIKSFSYSVDETLREEFQEEITMGIGQENSYSMNVNALKDSTTTEGGLDEETAQSSNATNVTNITAEAATGAASAKKATNNDTTKDTSKASEEDSNKGKVNQEEEEPEALYSDIGISVAKDYVNIRKSPSTDSEVLGKLYRNSAATVISTKGDWYYVESGSVTGYIKSEFLKTGISDDELIKKYSKQKAIVEVDGLNVRKECSTESSKLTVVYQNEKYPVLKQNGEWLKINIEDENISGYVKSEFVDIIVSFEDAVSKEEEQKILQLEKEAQAKKETEVKQGSSVSYTKEDLMLLACLVHSEAGTQSYEGKLAVANVVLNRIKSSKFPNTLKAVIYQSGQFSVAASGSLSKQLNNYSNYSSNSQLLSIKAAKAALEGANNIGSRLYFHSYQAAKRKGYTSKSNSVKLGDHLFW